MTRAPLVLLVTDDEWVGRSLTSVLAPRGYAILRAYSAEQALKRAATADPDAVFVSSGLEGTDHLRLCQVLLEQELVAPSVPIIVLASMHTSREEKLRALEAGAWDVVRLPLDGEEFLLRLQRFTQGKIEIDREREHHLVDQLTGFYTREGILQRVREAGAAAERFGRPIACIVITTGGAEKGAEEQDDGEQEDEPLSAREVVALADRLRGATRQSDVLARIGASDFVVIATDTPPRGADILANRLREQAAPAARAGYTVRAGVYAIEDPRIVKLDPIDLIQRAASATRPRRAD